MMSDTNGQLADTVPELLRICKELADIFPEFSISELDAADFKDRGSRIWTTSQSAKNIIAKIKKTTTYQPNFERNDYV